MFCIRIFLKRVLGDPIVENKEIVSDRVTKCVGMESVMKAENCVEKVKNVSNLGGCDYLGWEYRVGECD